MMRKNFEYILLLVTIFTSAFFQNSKQLYGVGLSQEYNDIQSVRILSKVCILRMHNNECHSNSNA